MREPNIDISKFRVAGVGPSASDETISSEGINVQGQAIPVSSVFCVAKTITGDETGSVRYYIKAATQGINPGGFFDITKNHCEELKQANHTSGRPLFEFKSVNADTFAFYLKFIETSNPAYLRNAERS